MLAYLVRRLLLLPVTLFCILLINFALINLAPGDPVTISEISPEGAKREDRSFAFGSDERWLQFRERYGLTLPIFFNDWPNLTMSYVQLTIKQLTNRLHRDKAQMSVKEYDALRMLFGDQSRYLMPKLLAIVSDEKSPTSERRMALRFFVRGGSLPAHIGGTVSEQERKINQAIAKDNAFLHQMLFAPQQSQAELKEIAIAVEKWYSQVEASSHFAPTALQKISIFFTQTRLCRYLSRILTLDFGTMRNDDNKLVIHEVTKRLKYSLTLSLTPLIVTFAFCLLCGLTMAWWHNSWLDHSLNLLLLILYALPIFVVAPWLIETVALRHYIPFTHTLFPLSGFTSSDAVYEQMTSLQRLADVLAHIALPLLAIMYGSLAANTRLARTAALEVARQDYVRTAKAKGIAPFSILLSHIGRNASITIVTSLASSLGVILGGSLIVETLFEIDGFGKFFYDAIVNRDYNVILFSALAGSALSLIGYLLADLAYTWLDPRLSLEDAI